MTQTEKTYKATYLLNNAVHTAIIKGSKQWVELYQMLRSEGGTVLKIELVNQPEVEDIFDYVIEANMRYSPLLGKHIGTTIRKPKNDQQ